MAVSGIEIILIVFLLVMLVSQTLSVKAKVPYTVILVFIGVAVDAGHRETDFSTVLHVPSAGLVVAGDVAYNDVHLMLAESKDWQKRMEWIAALDQIESLKPRAVIAGHIDPDGWDRD